MLFQDRTDAGQRLAEKLTAYANNRDVLVLGLARGGVPVAFEVAKALDAPLDVFLVRKLGVPGNKELAMGAIASGGICILNEKLIAQKNLSKEAISKVIAIEERELLRRERVYRHNRPILDVEGRIIILVDDGLATGATMRAAVTAIRQQHPQQIVAAVAVSAPETCDKHLIGADRVVCAETPEQFFAVGLCYKQFSPTEDAEIIDLLERAAARS
ncbi:phosphoribosyltransferase [Myxosarcina sp. GI1]|uniref:phosphoribosyltransferase n=1 Tax=Myxosarcina sp. GI1 TaxID=1541065 RepID=UPI0005605008|nr:phosphoribosyltransferase [Myxosarcina sp. GI1]